MVNDLKRNTIVLSLILSFFVTITPLIPMQDMCGQHISDKNHEQNTILVLEWRTNITSLIWRRHLWCVTPLLSANLDMDEQQEIVVATNSSVLCLDGMSGAIEWNVSMNLSYRFYIIYKDIHALLLKNDSAQLVIANNRRIISLNASNGETLWSITLGENVCDLYSLNGDIIATTDTSVIRIDKGEILWERTFSEPIKALPEPTNNTIVVCTNQRIIIMDVEGGIIKELPLDAECIQNKAILYDMDMDKESEILIPLKNKTVTILGLNEFDVEHSLTLPGVARSISIGALNPNNIPDFVFFVKSREAVAWFDFSEEYTIGLRRGEYMLIWDLNNDGWGDIVAGSSEWMEMDILLSPGILIDFTWHGWDIIVHFFDKMYIVDILSNFVLDIILSQQASPNNGWITCIDGEYILGENPTYTFAPADRAFDSYLVLRPPILIDDIDADGILEIVTTFHTKEYPPTYGIETYEIKDTTHTYTGIICEETFVQMKNDGDLDFLPDTIEIEIGTNTTIRDTDNDTLPDGWEYMNKLNPLDPQDAILDNDDDGLNNIAEYKYGGDPWDSDTDDDGLSDYDEARIGTNLRLNDTDGDGYSDGYEVFHGTDPLDPSDYPASFIGRYWWVLIVLIVAVFSVVFFLGRISRKE